MTGAASRASNRAERQQGIIAQLGQDITATSFDEADFARFAERLARETALLRVDFAQGRLSHEGPRAGFELEAWLVDRNFFPAPHNQAFLARLDDPMVVPELSRFNIELNGEPRLLEGEGLGLLERSLAGSLAACVANAHADVDTVIAIGTLPTLRESDLSLANMTPSNRYVALNHELRRLRDGAPVRVAIDSAEQGAPGLATVHDDVMLEAATTSFQLHLQVAFDRVAANLNASMALSAPLVALAANSPFLFGCALWHETRIPLFEQAFEPALGGQGTHRVSFGSGWCPPDPTAIFAENVERFPVLLPVAGEGPDERLACLRLHNGTIWRWNRLLAGFDEDGGPHLRIEQRVMPAGPTVIDMMANAAFFYGACAALADRMADPDAFLPFSAARDNFQRAARLGMGAVLDWPGGPPRPARAILAELLPLAREGLGELGVSSALVDRYLDVIAVRVASGRNGAQWQLDHFARHGDLFGLTAQYLEHQRSGMPVHEWPL